MTDLLNANKRKNEYFDPYNPFSNPMENPKYNMDYSEIFNGIDEKKRPARKGGSFLFIQPQNFIFQITPTNVQHCTWLGF